MWLSDAISNLQLQMNGWKMKLEVKKNDKDHDQLDREVHKGHILAKSLSGLQKKRRKKMIKKKENIYCCYIFTIPLLVIEFLEKFIQITM